MTANRTGSSRPTSLSDLPTPPAGNRGWPWDVEPEEPPTCDGEWPSITLVTPSFNQVRFIEATLRSVILQRYPRLEYVVMDGGSTDGSVEVIRRYEPWLSRWVSRRDRGQSDAINQGLAEASGRIVGWLNTDDRLTPGALWRMARFARSNPEAVAWAGVTRSVTPEGRLVYTQSPKGLSTDELADWGRAGLISQPACVFTRDAWQRVGALDETYHYAMDFDLWLRLSKLGRIASTSDVWAHETIHEGAKSIAQRGRSLAEVHLIQIRHGYERVALERMAEAFQERETLRSSSPTDRLRRELNLWVRPVLDALRRR